MNKNLKELNVQGQSPVFIEKSYVWFVKKGGKLRKAVVKSTGKRMLDVAKSVSNKDFSYGLAQYRLQKMLSQMMYSTTWNVGLPFKGKFRVTY